MIKHVLEKIAELRNITPEEAGEITAANARRFFGYGEKIKRTRNNRLHIQRAR